MYLEDHVVLKMNPNNIHS